MPATFGQRLAARLIDGIILLILSAAVPAVLISMSTLRRINLYGAVAGLATAWIGLSLIPLVYLQSCERTGGRTVGRAAVGIRLIRLTADGGAAPSVGWWRALGRRFVAGLGDCLFLLGSLSMLWHSRRRTWGDRASGTAVVQSRAGRGPARALCLTAGTAALLICAVVLLAMLPENAGDDDDGSSTTALPTEVATTPPAAIGAPAAFVRTWTMDEAEGHGDGDGGQVTLDVGDANPYAPGAVNGRDTAGSSCTASSATDAMIPFRITITNTSSATNLLGIRLDGIGGVSIPDFHGPVLNAEIVYSDGSTCKGTTDGATSFGTQADLAASAVAVSYGYFIVHNIYGSENGGGSTAAILADARLTVNATQPLASDASATPVTVTSVVGPDVVSGGGAWSFPLGEPVASDGD